MSIEITLDFQAIQNLQQKAIQSAKETLEEVVSGVKNDIPLNQGALQRSEYVDMQTENGQTHIFIDHNCEYARYVYFGKKMVNEKTGKGPAMIYDEYGNEVGLRYPKGAKLKATDEDLNLNSGKAKWLEPYIDGDKKDFILTEFTNIFRKNTGV